MNTSRLDPTLRFKDRKVFISGGSKGIGFAIAERFAEEGAEIFLCASHSERLRIAGQKLTDAGCTNVKSCAVDLSTLAGCEMAVSSALEQFGSIDILINSAGATKGGLFPEQSDQDMVDGFALKFHAAVRLARLLWPSLVRSHGNVINIVGGFARTPDADFMVGGAVNAALGNFSKALAAKGLEDDVNVNWIHPGLTVTDRLQNIFRDRAQQQNRTIDQIEAAQVDAEGIRRLGQPQDIAALVAFLCSDEARHIHGSAVTIDGGGSRGYY